MKIILLTIGSTDKKFIREGFDEYVKRLSFYLPLETRLLADLKNRNSLNKDIQRAEEGKMILNQLSSGDFVVLLDDHGVEL